ncbi:MAG: hypothetical protein O3B05_00720 [archaeon]|nr:hypothetical protein [archaeon]
MAPPSQSTTFTNVRAQSISLVSDELDSEVRLQMGCTMQEREQDNDLKRRVKDLQGQVDDLRDLVNTLLSVICEEPDGEHSGAAPALVGGPQTAYCM